MTAPSRAFLVQQATLNSIAGWYANTVSLCGMNYTARRLERLMREDFTEGRTFARRVRTEFDRLSERFAKVAA